MVDLATILFLFLNRFALSELRSYVFCNEEGSFFLLTFLLGAFSIAKTHLLVIWRSEYIFCLSILSQLTGEDLTLYVHVRLNVRNW